MIVLLADAEAVLIASWQPFYTLLGTGAAALLGLLFVAMSLRHSMELSSIDIERSIWSAGSISLAGFANILALSLVFMVPEQHFWFLGLVLILLGGATGIAAIALLFRRRSGLNRRTQTMVALATLSFLLEGILALPLLQGNGDALKWLALVLVTVLADALLISWVLLATPLFMRISQQQQS